MEKIKKILIPVDFSKRITRVYGFAEEVAKKYEASVDLIHVIPKQDYMNLGRIVLGNPAQMMKLFERLKKRCAKELKEDLEEHLSENHRGDVYVKTEARISAAVIDHAQKEGYDLIMLASRGKGNSRFTRGSEAEKIIRLAKTPVMSINKGFDPNIENIVVPTDGSDVSFEALPMALFLAQQNKASIQLLSVSELESQRIKASGRKPYINKDNDVKEYIVKGLIRYISDHKEQFGIEKNPESDKKHIKFKNKNNEVFTISVKVMKAVSAYAGIVDYASEQAELVVMATHGHSGLAKFFLGSTTEKIVRHLKMPLLTVKPKKLKKKSKGFL